MSEKSDSTTMAVITDGPNKLAIRLADLPIEQRTDLVVLALLRYREGEHIFQIAQDLGVSRAGLYRHILAIAPEQWKEAKVARALDDVEQAEDALRTAKDTHETTRAREQHRAAAWMLERLRRDQFGQEATNNTQAVQININLRRDTAPD
jgi:DNA-binding phage protein